MTPPLSTEIYYDKLLKSYRSFFEFETMSRLYGILFLQILLFAICPWLVYSDYKTITNEPLHYFENIWKGLTILLLACRASHYQLYELALVLEGFIGRSINLLLLIIFIGGVYISFDNKYTEESWLLITGLIIILYSIKTFYLKLMLRFWGNKFLNKLSQDALNTSLYIAIKRWTRNSFLLGIVFVISWLIATIIGIPKPYAILIMTFVILLIGIIWILMSETNKFRNYIRDLDEIKKENINDDVFLNIDKSTSKSS